jgi:hypothetical protein
LSNTLWAVFALLVGFSLVVSSFPDASALARLCLAAGLSASLCGVAYLLVGG